MHFTRRLLDRRVGVAFGAALASFAGCAVACSSTDDEPTSNVGTADAAADSAITTPVDANAGLSDGGLPAHDASDASMPDAAPLPVVCASASCATSLVTSSGEGFCALLHDGTVACWGQNSDGQLGRGDDGGTLDSATPSRVLGLSDIVTLHHTCAVDKTGGAWCWGTGPFLRNDSPSVTTELTPVKLPIPPAKSVGVTKDTFSRSTTCALLEPDAGEATEPSVMCWGSNYYGQIAIPDPAANPYMNVAPQTKTLPAGAPIRDFIVGSASFLLREDGIALSWGASPPVGRVSSLFPDPYLAPVSLSGISSIDVDVDKACAIAGGVAYCWGAPIDAYLDPPLGRALPQPVATKDPVVQIATTAGAFRSAPRGCACSGKGDVYCWGPNESGQAGDGTKDFAGKAVSVVGLPGPAAQVRTTARATCALLTDGTIYCWGDDVNGQLGGGQFKTPSVVPQKVILP